MTLFLNWSRRKTPCILSLSLLNLISFFNFILFNHWIPSLSLVAFPEILPTCVLMSYGDLSRKTFGITQLFLNVQSVEVLCILIRDQAHTCMGWGAFI